MSQKTILHTEKSVATSKALAPPLIVPATNAQAHLVGMRVDQFLEPDDVVLQEDPAATPGDGIETGAGQGGQVLLAQAPPAATPPAGAPPVSSGAAAAGAAGAATIPTALLVLGGLGLVAAAAGGSGDASASATPTAITSNGGAATAAVNVAENATAVTTVVGTADAGETLTYSITGGPDASRAKGAL